MTTPAPIRSTSRARWAAVLVFVVATAIASCTNDDDTAVPPTDAPPPTTAGPRLPSYEPHQDGVALPDGLVTKGIGANCVACHREIVEAYRSSAMFDSLTLPTGAGSPEADMVGRTFVDEATGITVRFGAQDGHYTQTAVYVDPGGVERARHDMRIDLVVGSGHATRSYFEIRAGRLLELPLTWYRNLGTAALSPGPGFQTVVTRNGTRLCVGCHTGTVEPVDVDADVGFRGTISLGIDCDRCHGDGELHAMTGDPAQIVDPAKLPEDRQSDLCYQCHLSGGLTIERRGRTIADYTVGENLSDWLAVFTPVETDVNAGATISSHAERMKLSRCYTETARSGDSALTCTTCHNPHRGHLDAGSRAAADRGCLVCHQPDDCHTEPAARADRACFECHMPRVDSRDIGHTRITDHFIRSRPPRDARPAPMHNPAQLADRGGPLVDHLDPEGRSPHHALYAARAYLRGVELAAVMRQSRAMDWEQRGLAALVRHESVHGTGAETLAARGRFLTLIGRAEEAVPLLRAAHEADPERAESNATLAYALADAGNHAAAIALLEKAASIDPYDEQIEHALAENLARVGRVGDALDRLEAVEQRVGPSAASASLALELARSVGDAPRALRHAYTLLMFRSRDAGAVFDAAMLCRDVDRSDERARPLLEEALRLDGEFVPALVELARSLLTDDRDRARELVRRAARKAPRAPAVLDLLERTR